MPLAIGAGLVGVGEDRVGAARGGEGDGAGLGFVGVERVVHIHAAGANVGDAQSEAGEFGFEGAVVLADDAFLGLHGERSDALAGEQGRGGRGRVGLGETDGGNSVGDRVRVGFDQRVGVVAAQASGDAVAFVLGVAAVAAAQDQVIGDAVSGGEAGAVVLAVSRGDGVADHHGRALGVEGADRGLGAVGDDHVAGGRIPVGHVAIVIERSGVVVPADAEIEGEAAGDAPGIAGEEAVLALVDLAVGAAGFTGAGGGQAEHEIGEAEAGEGTGEGVGAVNILGNDAIDPGVVLILGAGLDGVASLGPVERVGDGGDAVSPRSVAVVAAGVRHGERREAGDGDGGEAHDLVAIGVHALQADGRDHAFALQRVKFGFGLTGLGDDAGAAHAELVAEAVGERPHIRGGPAAIARSLGAAELLAHAACRDGSGLVLHPVEVELVAVGEALIDAAEGPVADVGIGAVRVGPGVVLGEGVGRAQVRSLIVVVKEIRGHRAEAVGGDGVVGEGRVAGAARVADDDGFAVGRGRGVEELGEIEQRHLRGGHVGVERFAVRGTLIHRAAGEIRPAGDHGAGQDAGYFALLIVGLGGIEIGGGIEGGGAALVVDLAVDAFDAVLGDHVEVDGLGGFEAGVGDGHFHGFKEEGVAGLRGSILRHAVDGPGLLVLVGDAADDGAGGRTLDAGGLGEQGENGGVDIGEGRILPALLVVDHAGDGAALRGGREGLLVDLGLAVLGFGLEVGFDAPDLSGLDQNAIGFVGLEVVGVDLDHVRAGADKGDFEFTAAIGVDLAHRKILAIFEEDDLDIFERRAGGIRHDAAQSGRLGLSEQERSREQEQGQPVEPQGHE